MFQIAVDDVLVILDKVLISGKCVNEKDFKPKLVDDNGEEYAVAIPFIKYISLPEPDYMTLELIGALDPYKLKGQTLMSA